MKRLSIALVLPLVSSVSLAQSAVDRIYTEEIRRQTTESRFATELVDHLPASSSVPSPLADHGYIAGAAGHLTYAEDVAAYMRKLAQASPRVKVISIGASEEGREMILVAISDADTIRRLDRYREITAKLADPRTLSESEARRLIAAGKPFYYATGSIHSPETGSPEMLMELAYRLAVEETPLVRSIRKNVITLLTPVVEVDGRDRAVDLWRYREANPDQPLPPLVYWGRYVAHDNNRDQIGMTLKLSQHVSRVCAEYHPQVIHDLHESIPFLYISTGTGPYNPALDPLVIDEWQRMAYHEVDELTRRGLPGVWTHGFYDGWAPNYMIWAAVGHNAVGRFYETFGNFLPITAERTVRQFSDRQWYRPNPPLPKVEWSLRDNVNYQQSGVLLALADMASHRERSLERFWELGRRAVAKARTEGPAAYVVPANEKRQGELADLLGLLRRHRIEVSVTEADATIARTWPPAGGELKEDEPAQGETSDAGGEEKGAEPAKQEKASRDLPVPTGSFVIRMDQPSSRLADTLLDTQYVRGEERVYDDTGWTLGYLKNVTVHRVVNPDVLAVPMHVWDGTMARPAAPPEGAAAWAIAHHADVDLARLRFAAPGASLRLAEAEFRVGEGGEATTFPVGTVLAERPDAALREALATLHLEVTALDAMPEVASHELRVPRVGLIHSWLDTQDEGWWRIGLESLGIPYTYLSTQDVAGPAGGDLRGRFDVLLFPPVGEDPVDIVNGLPPGPPIPWRKSELTPNLGAIDATDDMRPGLDLRGIVHLRSFVREGGLLITARDTSELAVQYGLARWVSRRETQKLKAPGTLVRARVKDRSSAVAVGYDETLPVYFARGPLFDVGLFRPRPEAPRPSGRGGPHDPDVPQGRPFVAPPERPKPEGGETGFELPDEIPAWRAEAFVPRPEDRPRVVVAFADAKELFLSGMLEGADELAGMPAVIDAPLGRGHILLMSINPMWRGNTQGEYALVTNALMSWDRLRWEGEKAAE